MMIRAEGSYMILVVRQCPNVTITALQTPFRDKSIKTWKVKLLTVTTAKSNGVVRVTTVPVHALT